MTEHINLDGQIQKIDECSLERRIEQFKEVPEAIIHREQYPDGDFILRDEIYYVASSGKIRYNEIEIGFYRDGPHSVLRKDTVMRKRNPHLPGIIGATLTGASGVYFVLTGDGKAPLALDLMLPPIMAVLGYLVPMMLFSCGSRGDSKAWKSYQNYIGENKK